MQVLEDEHRRPALGQRLDEPSPRREVLVTCAAGRVQADERPQTRFHPRRILVGDERCDCFAQLPLGVSRSVALEDPRFRLHHLGERPERAPLAVRQRATLAPVGDLGLALELAEELGNQAALPDPRHADDREELRRALSTRAFEGAEQQIALTRAPDKRRLGCVQLDPHPCPRLHGLPDRHGLGFSLGVDGVVVSVLDHVLRRAVRLLGDDDSVRRRSRLQPGSGVDDVAGDHRLSGLRPRVDVHERLARVDGDANLELGVLDDAVADRERGAYGAFRIVLVRDGRAEDGHHGVTDELLDGPTALLELRAQPLVIRTENRLDVLRVERLRARSEADEVREENRDDLAFASQRTDWTG